MVRVLEPGRPSPGQFRLQFRDIALSAKEKASVLLPERQQAAIGPSQRWPCLFENEGRYDETDHSVGILVGRDGDAEDGLRPCLDHGRTAETAFNKVSGRR